LAIGGLLRPELHLAIVEAPNQAAQHSRDFFQVGFHGGEFASYSCSYGKVCTTGGADTQTHTGVTDYNETGIEVADHPDHRHDLTTTDYYDIQSGGATLIHST
jgi:hypothetical protein